MLKVKESVKTTKSNLSYIIGSPKYIDWCREVNTNSIWLKDIYFSREFDEEAYSYIDLLSSNINVGDFFFNGSETDCVLKKELTGDPFRSKEVYFTYTLGSREYTHLMLQKSDVVWLPLPYQLMVFGEDYLAFQANSILSEVAWTKRNSNTYVVTKDDIS